MYITLKCDFFLPLFKKQLQFFPTEAVLREGQIVQAVAASGRPQMDGVRPPAVPHLPQRARAQLN